ncbi:hypothetical protein [Acuticoccus kandeliae]|uniref:hypothetical protein n=1 Tax=Acuticoccus kandeliae TaxID=2073160 RepID=UPI000D3EC639|nr:hypothetical protein [Acuticoccus kandeliae]
MAQNDPLEPEMIDMIASRTLAAEAEDGGAGGAIPVAELARRAASREGFAGLVTIPIGAIGLYRRLRAANALLSSPTAYAAATEDGHRRIVDGVEIRTVVEAHVVWLVITLKPGGAIPAAIELLGADGRIARLPLSAPIDGVIQFGLGREDAAEGEAAALLLDPATHIFLL